MKGGEILDIWAPAKINLFLSIKAKRPDGYHELETVFQKVDLADRLFLKKVPAGVSIQCKTSGLVSAAAGPLPEDETNLAYRAATAFFAKAGLAGGVEIVLEKNIPVAAGLGGGSSDAAAVLRGLNRMYSPGLELDSLLAVALELGADVPFFVTDGFASFANGVGELLTTLPALAKCWIVLINPGFPVSTKWAFENFALTSGDNPDTLGRGLNSFSDCAWFGEMLEALKKHGLTTLYNDLESVTVRQYPEIGKLKDQLQNDGALLTMMSGSGPTLFGIFAERYRAEKSYNTFKERYAGVFICRPC